MTDIPLIALSYENVSIHSGNLKSYGFNSTCCSVIYIYIAYDKVVSPYSIALLMLRYPLIKLIYEMDSLFGKYGSSLGFSLLHTNVLNVNKVLIVKT